MTRRRVLILHEPGLLAQGLRSLLEADSRLEIISLTGDVDQLALLIRQVNPDAVVVERDKFPLSLGDPPHAVQLDAIPLVISLSQNENRMRIYRIQERSPTGLKELIETLLEGRDEP